MTFLTSGKTTLRNVLVQGDGRDPLALQLHLGRLLSAADLGCAGLPPSTCLIVRHLSDPLPGKLRLESGARRPPDVWERAVQQALESQARQAARPARGPVSADANAVLFADRAELLACLAADFLAGLLSAHWWWRSLFPNADLPRAALTAWQDSPEDLPAALELLAQRGGASVFVRNLDPQVTRQMLSRLIRCFGLNKLEQALQLIPEAESADVPLRAANAHCAPWHSIVPESLTEGLSVEQQILIGVALTLQRAPMLARSLAFSNSVQVWREAVSFPQKVDTAETRQQPATGKDTDFETATEIETAPDVKPEMIFPGEAIFLPQAETQAAPPCLSQATETPTSATHDPGFASRVDLGSERSSVGKTEARADPVSRQRIEFIADTKPEKTFASKSGFSPETEPLHPMSPLIAKVSDDQRVTVDVEIAPGRRAVTEPQGPPIPEPVNISATSVAAETFAVPALEATSPVETVITQYGGVFYLLNLALALGLYGDFSMPLSPGLELSPWDFLALVGRALIGPSLEDDPIWRLLARLAVRSADQSPGQGFEPPDGLPLTRWLQKIVAQVRSQLLLALGLEQETALHDLFFAHPARIEQSSSRLDIFFSLAEHPIQIRMAGLDRDPGWIPAAARSVVYHYD